MVLTLNLLPKDSVQKKEEHLRRRGGATSACSRVRDTTDTGRLLSQDFSQNSPRTRMSKVGDFVKRFGVFEKNKTKHYKASVCNSQSTL